MSSTPAEPVGCPSDHSTDLTPSKEVIDSLKKEFADVHESRDGLSLAIVCEKFESLVKRMEELGTSGVSSLSFELVEMYTTLGNAYSRLGSFDVQIAFQKKLLQVAEMQDDADSQWIALYNIGNGYKRKKEYKKAIESYNKALDVLDYSEENPTTAESTPGEEHIYHNLGRVYCALGEYEKCLHFHREAYKLAVRRTRENNSSPNSGLKMCNREMFLRCLADAYGRVGKHAKALEFWEQYHVCRCKKASLGRCAAASEARERSTPGRERSFSVSCVADVDRLRLDYLMSLYHSADSDISKGNCKNALEKYEGILELSKGFISHSVIPLLGGGDGDFCANESAFFEATVLASAGVCATRLQLYEKALGFHKTSLEIVENLGDRKTLSEYALKRSVGSRWSALLNLGDTYFEMNDFDLSLEFYGKCVALAKANRDFLFFSAESMHVFHNIEKCVSEKKERSESEISTDLNFFQDKIEEWSSRTCAMENAYHDAERLLDVGNLVAAKAKMENVYMPLAIQSYVQNASAVDSGCIMLASIYNSRRDYAKTIDCCVNQIKSRHADHGMPCDHNEKLLYENMGTSFVQLRQFPKAAECFERAHRIAGICGDEKGEAEALCSVRRVFEMSGDCEKADSYQKMIMQVIGHMHGSESEKVAYAKELFERANGLSQASDYNEAVRIYELFIRLIRGIGNRQWECAGYAGLGVCNEALSRQSEAVINYEKSFMIAKEIGYKYGERVALTNLGVLYQSMKKLDDSASCFIRSLDMNSDGGSGTSSAVIFNRLTQIYGDLGEKSKEEDTLKKYIGAVEEEMKKSASSYMDEEFLSSLLTQAQRMMQKEDYESAVKLLNNYVHLCRSQGRRRSLSAAFNQLGNAYEKLGHPEKANDVRAKLTAWRRMIR